MSHSQARSLRRRPRDTMPGFLTCLCLLTIDATSAYLPSLPKSYNRRSYVPTTTNHFPTPTSRSSSGTALNVWWFGGTEQSELNDGESCELVAVRIERTSPNSRRIAGDITIPAPLEDVWAILTDYDRLATHIPNLVESRIVGRSSAGRNGDGQFRCRLFQKGAQKIVGFEFGASLSMDMREQIVSKGNKHISESQPEVVPAPTRPSPQERKIHFKCVDSQFFSEFDGEWRVKEQIGPDGQLETICYYVVDVRPKGPVPVAALEWRIREDVPTNLRAVKSAALSVGYAGVQALNGHGPRTASHPRAAAVPSASFNGSSVTGRTKQGTVRKIKTKQPSRQPARELIPVMADWDRDETMAKYL